MATPVFQILAASFRRFNRDKCWTSAVVISYFSLLCSVPLIALFFAVTARFLGDSEMALRSLNLFTDEFFAKLDPAFFKSLEAISTSVTKLGLFGLLGSLVAASLLFSNLISTVNHIFRTKYHKSFFYNRLMEYALMFIIGLIMLFSLAITAVWTALDRAVRASALVRTTINPDVAALINNFFLQYLIPYALAILVFFVIYKFIPETKVHTQSAAVSAAIAALLYEIFKRIFAIYVVHFSAIGIVLSRLLQGTLTSIIFFLLWISASLVIMLWGAELAAVLNERREAAAPQAPPPAVTAL
ncbi:MAG: YihY/virulence factor BrkB family protein [Candidatus Aminicenantes bacterium]